MMTDPTLRIYPNTLRPSEVLALPTVAQAQPPIGATCDWWFMKDGHIGFGRGTWQVLKGPLVFGQGFWSAKGLAVYDPQFLHWREVVYNPSNTPNSD